MQSRKNSSWMNLWGLLGETGGNEKKKSSASDGGEQDGKISGGRGSRDKEGSLQVEGDEFANFDGFSFEQPTLAASQVLLDSLQEEEEEVHVAMEL